MKRIIAASTALAAGLLVAVAAGPASAAPPQRNDLGITVNANGTGHLDTHFVHQGYLRLHVAEAQGSTVTVVDLHNHHRIGELLAAIDLQLGENPKPADAARSTRIINRIASAFGGADVENPDQFRSDTIYLPHPGDYYAVGVGQQAHNIGVIHAGHRRDGIQPHADATLLMGVGTHDIFAPRGLTIPTHGTLRVANLGDGIHLFQMSKVADGVTDAQVQAEFDTLMKGQQPTSDPAGLMSAPRDLIGTDAMTPHNADYLRYRNLPRGEYLALCFIADDETGVPHAFMGMHLIIHVR